MVAIDFTPHGAQALFKMPMGMLKDKIISVDDMEDSELSELQNRLMDEAMGQKSTIGLIECFLKRRINSYPIYEHKRMEAVVNSINRGENQIASLASISCLSYKQFQRVFRNHIGSNPKDFLRVVRFQRVLYYMQHKFRGNFTQLALACGYYDQAHFVKEFKFFTGWTPKEYIAHYNPYSDYFQ